MLLPVALLRLEATGHLGGNSGVISLQSCSTIGSDRSGSIEQVFVGSSDSVACARALSLSSGASYASSSGSIDASSGADKTSGGSVVLSTGTGSESDDRRIRYECFCIVLH